MVHYRQKHQKYCVSVVYPDAIRCCDITAIVFCKGMLGGYSCSSGLPFRREGKTLVSDLGIQLFRTNIIIQVLDHLRRYPDLRTSHVLTVQSSQVEPVVAEVSQSRF